MYKRQQLWWGHRIPAYFLPEGGYVVAATAEEALAKAKEKTGKDVYKRQAQAAQLALDANVRQLVIGHFSARYEDESVLLHEASAILPQTILAKENLCSDVDGGTVYEK